MAEQVYQVRKLTAVPSVPTTPNTVFYVAPAATPNYVEIYVSNAAGDAIKRVINQADVQAMINASINNISKYQVVADIAARNALTDKTNLVYVKNATGDTTVKNGGATYIYDSATSAWVKTSEAESMDLVFSWENLQNKPTSTVAAIDAAVLNSHAHTNKTQLDDISELNGLLSYKGKYVTTTINDDAW